MSKLAFGCGNAEQTWLQLDNPKEQTSNDRRRAVKRIRMPPKVRMGPREVTHQ